MNSESLRYILHQRKVAIDVRLTSGGEITYDCLGRHQLNFGWIYGEPHWILAKRANYLVKSGPAEFSFEVEVWRFGEERPLHESP